MAVKVFYVERKTMTKWRKVGDSFEPIEPEKWRIDRDPKDVLDRGYFTGPYISQEYKPWL